MKPLATANVNLKTFTPNKGRGSFFCYRKPRGQSWLLQELPFPLQKMLLRRLFRTKPNSKRVGQFPHTKQAYTYKYPLPDAAKSPTLFYPTYIRGFGQSLSEKSFLFSSVRVLGALSPAILTVLLSTAQAERIEPRLLPLSLSSGKGLPHMQLRFWGFLGV